jgi:predicted nucleic acid binding AN1-type Zn finger protein
MRPSSSSSSISSSGSENEETMQIFIKNVSGTSSMYTQGKLHALASHNKQADKIPAIPLTLPSNTSLSTLRSLLALRSNLSTPSDLRLVHAGKHLCSPSTTLADYDIAPNSTLHMALPLRGGMPPKKIRCSFKECRDQAQRIVGDCGFCNGHYCGKHRLLEDHKCEGLENCKKESHERNAERLNSERTVAIKGV